MGAHHTVRGRGKSRKDGLHPFLCPSLTAVILSSFNPHFSQSPPPPSPKSPVLLLGLFPCLSIPPSGPGKGIMFLPNQPKGQIKMCCTHSLSVCLIFLETKAQCKCSIFFFFFFFCASDSFYLVKSCGHKAAFRTSTCKTHAHIWICLGFLNPSGQISLIWAEKQNPQKYSGPSFTHARVDQNNTKRKQTNKKQCRPSLSGGDDGKGQTIRTIL